jgi:hypothetical protein
MKDNALIAEFMGEVVFESQEQMQAVPLEELKPYRYIEQLQYNTSWDWLMPVVERISQIHRETFKYDFKEIAAGRWPKDDKYLDVIAAPSSTPISEAYSSVVEFIRWYNDEKAKQLLNK